ncbi:MAG: hypothetical protein FAZ92_04012 [Accumulibacter sp.]|nr:MAG: hypothetical protein FAZ92_04012 [Accumulibacter sp.]
MLAGAERGHDEPDPAAALLHRHAHHGMSAFAREGHRLRAWRDRGSRGQGRQGPRHDAAEDAGRSAAGPPRARQGVARGRTCRGLRRTHSASCSGTQVSACGPRMGLAVCLRCRQAIARPTLGSDSSAPRRSAEPPVRDECGSARGGDQPVGHTAHPAPFVRDLAPGKRSRHRYGAGAVGACGCVDDDDLHACAQSRRAGRARPARRPDRGNRDARVGARALRDQLLATAGDVRLSPPWRARQPSMPPSPPPRGAATIAGPARRARESRRA